MFEKLKVTPFLWVAVAASALSFGSTAALAQGGPPPGIATGESDCDVINFQTSIACVAPVDSGEGGNVTAQQMTEQGIFSDIIGLNQEWSLLGEISFVQGESGASSTPLPSIFSVTYTTFDDDDDAVGGTWKLEFPFTWGAGNYAFAVKGGAPATGKTYNAVYLMNKNFLSGIWTANDIDFAMSNIRLFGTAPMAIIPLPAAGWLLLTALGGLGVAGLRRRRKVA